MWIVVLLVAVAVLAGVELAVREYARHRTAERLGGAMRASVHVEPHGWPFTWHLARGMLPGATITAHGVPVGDRGARIRQLRIDLTDVAVPWRNRQPGGASTLRAGAGSFEAYIDSSELVSLTSLPAVIQDLQLTEGGGLDVVTMAGLRVRTKVSTRDGAIVIRPTGKLIGTLAGVEITVPLPRLPAGATVQWVEVRPDAVHVGGPLDGDRLLEE